MFTFEVVELKPVTIAVLKGRLDAAGALILEEEIKKIDSIFPVLDFSCVNYLSSAGIRVVLQAEKSLRSQNGKIIFASMPSNVKQVLEITGLLNQFTISNSKDEAIETASMLLAAAQNKFRREINQVCYSVKSFGNAASTADIWETGTDDKENLAAVSLNDFRFGFGIGGLGTSREDVKSSSGRIIVLNKLIGVLPNSGCADYLITENSADTFFYINSACNLSGDPSLLVEIKNEKPVLLKDFLKNSFSIISDVIETPIPITGYVLQTEMISETKSEQLVSVGITVDQLNGNNILPDLPMDGFVQLDTNLSYTSIGVTLKNTADFSQNENIDDNINQALNQDNISNIVIPDIKSTISSARLWIFLPKIQSAQHSRLKIEFENLSGISDEFEIIIRKIYSDCSRIKLQQLHGGFSAKTFRVYGYDKKGIRILPTVLKLAKTSTVKREASNYEENVKRYILNNGTSVMGNYYYGEYGGIRYNFVGITGPDSQIGWLTNYYIEKSSDELLPIFDRIFTDVLRPWYGQPRLETFYPYKEHNPTFVFFPEMFSECEKELGISADCEKIFSEELGREIINPYWFLKYGYKERENKSKLWYKCICHGDLNMQNILLDEIKNVYVIDYSETSSRNAVSDFARLEPIFKFEFTKLENADDIKSLLTFEEGLLKPNKLDELPKYTYNGPDANIEKAFKLICRLRQYANTVTLFENDIIPYLLAVLEWTYAIVCYQSVNKIVKRASALSAALICEKILELEKKN